MAVKWSKKYETGMRDIDQQHHDLIDILNKFLFALQAGETGKPVIEIMDFLEKYVYDHFRTEEAYQIKYKYPEYQKHKTIHETFKVKLKNVKSQLLNHPDELKIAVRIQRELISWLIDHIQTQDKQLGQFLKNIN